MAEIFDGTMVPRPKPGGAGVAFSSGLVVGRVEAVPGEDQSARDAAYYRLELCPVDAEQMSKLLLFLATLTVSEPHPDARGSLG